MILWHAANPDILLARTRRREINNILTGQEQVDTRSRRVFNIKLHEERTKFLDFLLSAYRVRSEKTSRRRWSISKQTYPLVTTGNKAEVHFPLLLLLLIHVIPSLRDHGSESLRWASLVLSLEPAL